MTTLYPFITRLEVDVNGFCTQRNNKQVRASHRFGSPSFNFNFLVAMPITANVTLTVQSIEILSNSRL